MLLCIVDRVGYVLSCVYIVVWCFLFVLFACLQESLLRLLLFFVVVFVVFVVVVCVAVPVYCCWFKNRVNLCVYCCVLFLVCFTCLLL